MTLDLTGFDPLENPALNGLSQVATGQSVDELAKASGVGLLVALAVPAAVGALASRYGGRSLIRGSAIGLAGTLVGGAAVAAAVGAMLNLR